jgi:CheY-like chemotaxis protein
MIAIREAKVVREEFTILVADRNRHISEFLQRELVAEGYRIELANDGRTVLTLLNKQSPDLLVLDLEIPYIDGIEILEKLQNEKSQVPVIVHTLLTQYANYPVVKRAAAFLEKQGSNIVGLKETIFEVLRHRYPERFRHPHGNGTK